MDLDFVCEKPFDELAYRFSYFSSLEPNFVWSMVPQTSMAIMGTSKNNTVVNHLLAKYENYFLNDSSIWEIN